MTSTRALSKSRGSYTSWTLWKRDSRRRRPATSSNCFTTSICRSRLDIAYLMSRWRERCSSPVGKSAMISWRVTFSPIGILLRSSSSIGPTQGSGFRPSNIGMVSFVVYPIRLCNRRPMMTSESSCMSCQSLNLKSVTRYSNSCCFWKRTCESKAENPSSYCWNVLSRTKF